MHFTCIEIKNANIVFVLSAIPTALLNAPQRRCAQIFHKSRSQLRILVAS